MRSVVLGRALSGRGCERRGYRTTRLALHAGSAEVLSERDRALRGLGARELPLDRARRRGRASEERETGLRVLDREAAGARDLHRADLVIEEPGLPRIAAAKAAGAEAADARPLEVQQRLAVLRHCEAHRRLETVDRRLRGGAFVLLAILRMRGQCGPGDCEAERGHEGDRRRAPTEPC